MNRARKRSPEEYARIYGTKGRVEFVGAMKCAGCFGRFVMGKPCENHHIKTAGISMKSDAKCIVPLCILCHAEIHNLGRQSFEKRWSVDLKQAAIETESAWQKHVGAVTPDTEEPGNG